MNLRLHAANDQGNASGGRSPRLLEWLARLTQPGFSLDLLPRSTDVKASAAPVEKAPQFEDWNIVAHIAGHTAQDFQEAGAVLPLTVAEIDYFRRNHRGTENHISRDFLTGQTDLPSPLSELYGLYLHRARVDAEAAFFVAQSTHSIRVAATLADLLTIGGFANGLEYVSHLGVTYSVPVAFDTSAEIDRANAEALRRLALPIDHPSHLLKLTPDEIGVLAAAIVARCALEPAIFLEKANLLCEARQDVNRLPTSQHFATALAEDDLPCQTPWVARMAGAYARVFTKWVAQVPQIQNLLN